MEDQELQAQQAGEEELSQAKDIFKSFTKTLKTLNVYPKQNPISQKFISELEEKFTSFLNTYGDLKLAVEQFAFVYKGKEVFYSEERTENLALCLFIDGVREFSFLQGLTRDELEAFIDIAKGVPKGDNSEDDMVTLLWEREFEHIGYFVPEDVVEESMMDEDLVFQESSGEVSATVQGADYSDLTIIPASIDLEIQPFSDDELKELKAELALLESENLMKYTLDMFLDLMRAEKDIVTSSYYAKGLVTLMEVWTANGNAPPVLNLVKNIIGLLGELKTQEKKDALKKTIEKLSTLEMIEWFILHSKQKEILEEYLALISPYAVRNLIAILGEVEDRRLRRFVCGLLIDASSSQIEVFGEFLSDSRWFLVRNIVMILGSSKHPKAVKFIEGVIGHPEAKVRRECIKSLESIGGEEVKRPLMRMLGDEDSSNRTGVIKALRRFDGEDVLKVVKDNIARDDFKKKPFPEKREFLETFGAIGKQDAFPLLQGFFRKKGFFKRDENLELRAAAAYGLAYVPTDEARRLLEGEADSKKSLLREACVASLKMAQRQK